MFETGSGRLAIIGVGLIGGSLARVLRGRFREIVGASRDTAHLARAVELGVIDSYTTDVAAAVQDADVVVVAVPLRAMPAVFAAMRAQLAPHAVVTDVGSAKGFVIDCAREALHSSISQFVPGHPIAGTESSGVEASFSELFRGARVILTPLPETAPWALSRVRELWKLAGAEVVEMDAQHHDTVLAATSHLPHMLAFALVESLARMEEGAEIFRYAAGGFRDFTRIAASDPVMWRDICLANDKALLAVLERFGQDLERLAQMIRRGDGPALQALFTRARDARNEYHHMRASTG
jgi:prephenate dehydrogenase